MIMQSRQTRRTRTSFTQRNWYVYLASYFMRNRMLGRKQPLLAGMKVTHACNLKCIHCPFWKRDQQSIQYHQGIRCLEALCGLGAGLLIFEGGEPFLWKDSGYDIRDLVGEAKKRPLHPEHCSCHLLLRGRNAWEPPPTSREESATFSLFLKLTDHGARP